MEAQAGAGKGRPVSCLPTTRQPSCRHRCSCRSAFPGADGRLRGRVGGRWPLSVGWRLALLGAGPALRVVGGPARLLVVGVARALVVRQGWQVLHSPWLLPRETPGPVAPMREAWGHVGSRTTAALVRSGEPITQRNLLSQNVCCLSFHFHGRNRPFRPGTGGSVKPVSLRPQYTVSLLVSSIWFVLCPVSVSTRAAEPQRARGVLALFCGRSQFLSAPQSPSAP